MKEMQRQIWKETKLNKLLTVGKNSNEESEKRNGSEILHQFPFLSSGFTPITVSIKNKQRKRPSL